jgi:hypothetical protein
MRCWRKNDGGDVKISNLKITGPAAMAWAGNLRHIVIRPT